MDEVFNRGGDTKADLEDLAEIEQAREGEKGAEFSHIA